MRLSAQKIIDEEEGFFVAGIAIVMGILICIALIIGTIFPLMENSMRTVKSSIEKEANTSNVTLSDTYALDSGSEVKGAEVIGEIRLRATDTSVIIQVDNLSGTYVFDNESYDSDVYIIGYTEIYRYEVDNEDKSKIKFTFLR